MADVIDADSIAAVRALWMSDPILPALLSEPPQSGKLKAGQGKTYAVISCKKGRPREYTSCGGKVAFHDYRQMTIRVYGRKDDAEKVLAAAGDRFNASTVLAYPSGARFIRWWPSDSTEAEDEATAKGQDVWQGVIEAEVWSVRTGA